jgi:hypothetical protein
MFSKINRKASGLIMVLLILQYWNCFAQNIDTIRIANGSFEDEPRNGAVVALDIRGWYDCGRKRFPKESPPDIHPGGYWQNKLPAFDGLTYLGLVVRANDSYEYVSQRLSKPLKIGKCYNVTVALAQSPKYISLSKLTHKEENFIQPSILKILLSDGYCGEKEIIAQSPPIDHEKWNVYSFNFKVKNDFKYITLQAFYRNQTKSYYNGHIFVDKLSDIVEIDCTDNK